MHILIDYDNVPRALRIGEVPKSQFVEVSGINKLLGKLFGLIEA